MKFLGLGVPELIIILIVILLIFGPKNLPKLGSAIGKTFKNLREGMDGKDGKKEESQEDQAAAEEVSPIEVEEDSKKDA